MKQLMSNSADLPEENPELAKRNKSLMEEITPPCAEFVGRVIAQKVTLEQLKAATNVLKLLSYDAPLRVFLPSMILDGVENLLAEPFSQEKFDELVHLVESASITLGPFISAFSKPVGMDEDVKKFLNHLCQQIRETESHDVEPEDATPLTLSYNPPKLGRAYYFTAHGQQVRQMRPFTIDGTAKKTYDDNPTTSDCSKIYPAVRGSTYLFLWFCPQHGHCYGFHIIEGSEGRKDAAAAMYTHMASPPNTVFYDFACNLEEYCLNRESGFFQDTRFFHDLFHCASHKCSPAYSSKGLVGMQAVNSSICEQFNAYLQCIKASAKQMSQVHFTFFVQYFIDIWNKKKSETFKKKINIAVAGAE